MALPNYSTWTDQQILTAFTEGLQNQFIDTDGTEDARWRAVANAALDGILRTPLGIEAVKRKRKWGTPVPAPAPGTLPDAVPIANPDRLAIV